MSEILNKKLFLLDLDGTIYHENNLIPGALNFFELLIKQNKNYVFLTNNSSKNKFEYIDKLNRLGIKSTDKNIISSIDSTILYIKENFQKAKVYLVGTNSFKKELINNNIIVVDVDYRDLDVDLVVVGYDTELNYKKITGACFYVSRGIKFIATNCDLICPIIDGKFLPDCGSICKMIRDATGVEPTFLGKPNPMLVKIASKLWETDFEDIICVGDRLYTDIALGINSGISTALVLSGETKMDDVFTSQYKPSHIFNSINDLYILLNKNVL